MPTRKRGNYQKAIAYAQQVFILNDSLKRCHQEKDALELATLLETQEKENMIAQQANAIRIHKIILLTVCLMLLCCVIMALVIHHSRIINRKNKAMAKQIDNRLFYKEELLKANEQIHQLKEKISAQRKSRQTLSDIAASLQETEETTAASSESKEYVLPVDNTLGLNDVEADEASKKNEKRLFEELDRKIRKDNLFLNLELNREQLLQLTQIGKNRLAPLIQTFTGENFNGYINSLRLEYSLLLKKFNHYTIEAIASDSGFNNVRTYQRLFRTKYDMTPAEYRKSLQENGLQ